MRKGLLVTGAVLGLSAPAAAASAAPFYDACRLLTAGEVQAATRVRVGLVAPDVPTASQTAKCRYMHADTRSYGATMIASVATYKPEKVDNQKKLWVEFMKSVPVLGVGDYAYYTQAASTLMAGRGDRAILIQLLDGPPAGTGRLEAMKTLARAALEKQ